MDISRQIIAQNRYALTGSAGEFVQATQALAQRVAAEGARGVLSYRFFTDGSAGVADVIYADAQAWIDHHDIAVPWPEFAALRTVARLESVALLGPVTPPMRDWMARHGLSGLMVEYLTPGGGFHR